MAGPKGAKRGRGGARPRRPFPEGHTSFADVGKVAKVQPDTLIRWGRSEAVYPVRDPGLGNIALVRIEHVARLERLLKGMRRIPGDFDLVGEVERLAAERKRKWNEFMKK